MDQKISKSGNEWIKNDPKNEFRGKRLAQTVWATEKKLSKVKSKVDQKFLLDFLSIGIE